MDQCEHHVLYVRRMHSFFFQGQSNDSNLMDTLSSTHLYRSASENVSVNNTVSQETAGDGKNLLCI